MRHDTKPSPTKSKLKIDPPLFRRTMGSFATGVTVVTVESNGATHAMTANAFMSGSLEPPLCVISIAKRAHTHAMILAARRFGINVLGADQKDLALYFAGKKSIDVEARFVKIAETPLLHDCAARIAASLEKECDCGDHTLFIGAVHHMDATDRPPLVYHSSAFAELAPTSRGRVPVPEFW